MVSVTSKKEQPASKNRSNKSEAPKIKRPSKIFSEYYSSIILLLIAALVGGGYLVIKPKIDEYKNLRAHSELQRQNITNEQQYLAGLKRSVSAARSIDPEVLDKVDKALPREFSIPQTLVMINRASKANNTQVSGIIFSPESKSSRKKTELQSMQMTLNVSAPNYAALKNFINSLEKSLRLIDIQMLTVSEFNQEGAGFTLQLSTYYYPSGIQD